MTNLDFVKTGNLIRKLRKDYGKTVGDLAKVIGVSAVTITLWESSKKRCSIQNMVKLAEFFNVSVGELIEGKLHDEGTIDWLKRNFDIEPYDVDQLIANKKVARLNEYYDKCISIKERFLYLLPKWVKEALTEAETEEFNYIKKYVQIDMNLFGTPYFGGHFNAVEENDLKKKLFEYFKKIEGLTDEAYRWEEEKLVIYRFKIEVNEIIKLGDLDLIGLVIVGLCNQQEKDELLARNIEGKTTEELTDNDAIITLVCGGGNCIYRSKYKSVWDEELIESIEGKIEEDSDRTEAWECCLRPGHDFSGQTRVYEYRDEWKAMTYEQYQKTINKKKTRYIEDLGSIKYHNPELFYRNLLVGKYDTYL